MPMLKKRMLLRALIHEIPGIGFQIGRQFGKSIEPLIEELTNIYSQLGLYDQIIDRIRLGGII